MVVWINYMYLNFVQLKAKLSSAIKEIEEIENIQLQINK